MAAAGGGGGGRAATAATAATIMLLLVIDVVAVVEKRQGVGWFPAMSGCDGGTSECLGKEEFSMGSEVNRRVLAIADNYISYRAIVPTRVPCGSVRGASYYNCQAGAQANPYSRGCSTIARCRTG